MKELTKIFSVLVLAIIAFACDNNFDEGMDDLASNTSVAEVNSNGDLTILGDKVELAHTVDNMLKAKENLIAKGVSEASNLQIGTTHYYVKISVGDVKSLDQLNSSEGMVFFDRPLDREIITYGEYYHDPELAANEVTYQYGVVTQDQLDNLVSDIPDLTYEILESAFMPEYYAEQAGGRINQVLLEQLEEEANQIAEKANGTENANARTNVTKIYPKGTIKVGGKGVHNILVVAQKGLKVRQDRTDRNGYYATGGTFKKYANMTLRWITEGGPAAMRIKRAGAIYAAEHTAKSTSSNWSHDFSLLSSNDKQCEFAFRCYIYIPMNYYHSETDEHGLRQPGVTTVRADWSNEIKHDLAYWTSINEVNVGLRERDVNKYNAWTIVGETSRRLALRSVYLWAPSISWMTNYDLDGFYAEGVKYKFMNALGYPIAYKYCDYNSMVPDLMDSDSDCSANVEGISLKTIENALNGAHSIKGASTTWNNWRDDLKDAVADSKRDKLDKIFEYWWNRMNE